MTEFVGLDMEMHFYEHYDEVLDQLDKTFNHIFKARSGGGCLGC